MTCRVCRTVVTVAEGNVTDGTGYALVPCTGCSALIPVDTGGQEGLLADSEHAGTELAWVRLELDILVSSHGLAPLTDSERARYEQLARREREILRLMPAAP